jgi:hypothetical protein
VDAGLIAARIDPLPAYLRQVQRCQAVQPVPIPHDCTDGYFGAYWRRPAAYLEPHIRAGMATLARLGAAVLRPGLKCLAEDLRSGAWDRANGHLRRLETLDVGYRLVVPTNLEPRNSIA